MDSEEGASPYEGPQISLIRDVVRRDQKACAREFRGILQNIFQVRIGESFAQGQDTLVVDPGCDVLEFFRSLDKDRDFPGPGKPDDLLCPLSPFPLSYPDGSYPLRSQEDALFHRVKARSQAGVSFGFLSYGCPPLDMAFMSNSSSALAIRRDLLHRSATMMDLVSSTASSKRSLKTR
jgi:hypothetical protein